VEHAETYGYFTPGFADSLIGKMGTHPVKSDNSPEFIAQEVTTWLRAHHVDTHFIDPGSPWQNGHNESFNGVFRDGCLNRWLFTSVQEARRIINHWLEEYNNERPHGALDGLTPRAFAAPCRSQSLQHAA